MLSDSRRSLFSFFVSGLLALTCVSCTTLRAPVDPPHFDSKSAISAKADGIRLRMTPVSGLAAYHELFQEDLPLLGIAVVWVSMRNDGTGTVDLAHSKWAYHRDGKSYRSLGASDLFARYYKARHIRAYTLSVDEKARSRVEKLLFSPTQLVPGMEQDGFLYFGIHPALAPDWADVGWLSVQNIRDSEGKKLSIRIHLSNANP